MVFKNWNGLIIPVCDFYELCLEYGRLSTMHLESDAPTKNSRSVTP